MLKSGIRNVDGLDIIRKKSAFWWVRDYVPVIPFIYDVEGNYVFFGDTLTVEEVSLCRL